MFTKSQVSRHNKNRSGATISILAAGLLAVSGLGIVLFYAFFRSSDEEVLDAILKPVIHGEFVAKVLDQGEVQSAENVEIKCAVGSRNGNVTVIDVVPEGTSVSEGDWLVTLDSSSFEKELEQQRLAVSNTQTQVIQSEASFEAAEATKEEYIKGTYVEQEKSIQNDKFNAEQDLYDAEAYLEHSSKLQAKGFITKQQLRSDRIAVDRAQNNVDLSTQRLDVLRNITRKKEIIQLNSDIAAAKVQVENAKESMAIEKRELSEIEDQLANCHIVVPEGVSGEVVFHKEFDRRGGSEWVLEPGATVRERQVLIKLPDPSKMEVKVLINEQSITAIKQKMPATISVDALNKKTLTGYVTKVNSYAEQGGFMSSSTVREYAVFVRIIDPPEELIPGMNASVTIQTEYQPSVLQAPLQCIYSANDTAFVLRKSSETKYETVAVTIAGENSQNVWIESGVDEGDMLIMDPGQYKELMDLPELQQESRIEIDLPDDMEETSGESKSGKRPESMSGMRRGGDSKRGGGMSRGGDGKRGGGDGKRGGGDGKRGGDRGGAGGAPSMGPMIDRTMERYDTNEDGQIDAEEFKEIDGRAGDRLKSADTDGDGNISREELKKSFESMMRQFSQSGGSGGGRPGGRGQ